MNKSNIYICLNIGFSSIKTAQFQETRGELSLMKFRLEELPNDKQEEELKKTILAKLMELAKIFDFKFAKVFTLVSGPKVMVRQLSIPFMKHPEMGGAIHWQIKNFIPYPVESAVFDYEILEEFVEHGAKKLKLMVAIVPKEEIDNIFDLLTQAQIKPVVISTAPISLLSLAKKAKWSPPDKVSAILDIGAQFTTINIVKNNTLVFSREVQIGGNNITKSMVGILISDLGQVDLDYKTAEKIKLDWGIPDENKLENITPEVSTLQISALIRPILERLVVEIRRSFAFYREESAGGLISKIILVGGSGALKNLAHFLSENLGMNVEVAVLSQEMKYSLSKSDKELFEKMLLRFSVCIGLGLTHGQGINLVPLSIKEEGKRRVRKLSQEAVVTAVICLLVLCYGFLYLGLVNIQKKVLVCQIQSDSLRPELEKAITIEQLKTDTGYLEQVKDSIRYNQLPWSEVLKELSNIVPPDVVFTYLFGEKDEVIMRGIIYAPLEVVEARLTNFMARLEQSIFGHVVLVNMRRLQEQEQDLSAEGKIKENEELLPKESRIEFELNCRVGR